MTSPLRRRLDRHRVEAQMKLDREMTGSPASSGRPGWAESEPGESTESRAHRERVHRLKRMIEETTARQIRRLREGRNPSPAHTEMDGSKGVAPDLPGSVVQYPDGVVRWVTSVHEPGVCHGRVVLSDILRVDRRSMAQMALLERTVVRPEKLLFLDTETTGLSRGTGTVPFIVGFGTFQDATLVVQQMLLEELGGEAPMLRAWVERLQDPEVVIVTFNGRAYDEPLLRTRAVLHRLQLPEDLAVGRHIDLLHCARRIYGLRLPRMRLVDLEVEVLGFRRDQDIEGCEVPEAYWSFLRHRMPHEMLKVLDHNRLDIVSLVALLTRMTTQFCGVDRSSEPEDQLGRARVAARAKDHQRALVFASEAARSGGRTFCTWRACMLAARSSIRLGAPKEAEVWLLEALGSAEGELELACVHLELTKLLEHRLGRPAEALRHALLSVPAETPATNERRCRRLRGKVDRTASVARSGSG
ncbi:MAG: ribonuclease H-like domain-containing protein [Myxococcota bacterium]